MEFDQIRYGCLQCGKSCRQDWDIWLSPERVRENYLELFVHNDSPFESVGENWRVRRQSGACASLDSQSRCSIHAQLSYRAKPYRCQQYPVLLVRTPDGLRVSASYTCTAVLEQHGPDLATLEREVEEWLDGPFFVTNVGGGLPWNEVVAMEAHFEELLTTLGWESAVERMLAGLATGFRENLPGHPLSWWRQYRDSRLSWQDSLPVMLSALLKPCFTSRDRDQWERFDWSLLSGESTLLSEFDYQGPAQELLGWAAGREPSPDLDRYRRSLWFRKQHLRCGGILSGFLMLWSVGPVYRVLNQLCGSQSALERMELNLFGHTTISEQIYPALAKFWLDQRKAVQCGQN